MCALSAVYITGVLRPSPGGAQVKKTSRLQQRMAATHRTANLSLPHHEPASLPPPTSEQLTASGPPVTSESTMAPLEGVSKEPQQRHAHNRGGLNEVTTTAVYCAQCCTACDVM